MALKPKFRGGNMAVRSSVVILQRPDIDYSDLFVANKGVGNKLSSALTKSKLQEASVIASNQQIYRKP
ncbi:MAG: hypothetical protein HOA17_07655 [Candidatus Melainabacteria bacterium]|jgi:hypothetical protein|nr:hypothetical protein [Candidatus Melainabacteria bacterium]